MATKGRTATGAIKKGYRLTKSGRVVKAAPKAKRVKRKRGRR